MRLTTVTATLEKQKDVGVGTDVSGVRLTITTIDWERVVVTVGFSFDRAPAGSVDFLIYDVLRAFPLDVAAESDTEFTARINVTNFRDRQQVPNGSWRFMAVVDGRRGPLATFPLARAGELEASGRAYLYNQNQSAYVVNFGLSQDDRADVIMRTYQLNRPAPRQPAHSHSGRN